MVVECTVSIRPSLSAVVVTFSLLGRWNILVHTVLIAWLVYNFSVFVSQFVNAGLKIMQEFAPVSISIMLSNLWPWPISTIFSYIVSWYQSLGFRIWYQLPMFFANNNFKPNGSSAFFDSFCNVVLFVPFSFFGLTCFQNSVVLTFAFSPLKCFVNLSYPHVCITGMFIIWILW